MSGRQLSGEPEEQVDLEGDVDGMDDDDGGYRRRRGSRDDSGEPEEEENNDDRRADDDGMDKVEGAGDGPEDEEEKRKWEELLARPPHGSEIFIGGLPPDITEEDLRELCEPLGEIFDVRLTKDKKTKEHFGYVHFAERASALKAVEGSEKYEIDGQVLEVPMAKPLADKKPDRSHRPGDGPNYPLPPFGGGYMGDPYGAYGGDGVAAEPAVGGAGDGPEDEEGKRKWEELLALPPHGSEVFIGGLPRDITEEDLRELCELPSGEIFEVRLVKDKKTKENKGFAFVTFADKDAAQHAVEDVQDREYKGGTLQCSLSQAKHRLFVGNVPKGLSEQELTNIIKGKGPGVVNIEMFKDQHDPNRNRGFLFVEYYNHACADYTRKNLTSPNFKVDGSQLTVRWAEPKDSTDASSAASQVKTIYVKGLPENSSKEKIKELFDKLGEVTKIVLPPAKAGHKRDFGFVHFAERSSALKAVKGSEKYKIDGQVLEVSMAKPLADKKPDHSHRPGGGPNYPLPPYGGGYMGDPYGAYGGGWSCIQPGPAPAGMRMVPMVLPDGGIGKPGGMPPPPPPRRGVDRRDGGRGGEGSHGRRYRPY